MTSITGKKALHNTLWLYGEKLVSMGLLLFVNIVLARQLGPEQFGVLQMLLAFVALFSPFIALGLNAIVVRELLDRQQAHDQILGTVLSLRFLGGTIGSLVAFTLSYFVLESFKPYVWLLLILLLGNSFTLFNVLEHWFQSRMEVQYVSRLRTLSMSFFGGLKIWSALVHSDVMWLVWITAAEWVFTNLVLFYLFWIKRPESTSLRVDANYGINLVKESAWLVLSGFAAVIYLKIDMVMLGIISTQQQVGVYAVAAKFSEIWYFFPTALAAAYFPKLLSERARDPQRYATELQSLIDTVFLLALVVIAGTLLLAPWFIPLLYGDAYMESVGLLQIHILAACFVFMRAIASKWLIAESVVKYSLVSQGLGAVVNVVLNWILIPEHSAYGAAWATFISYSVAGYLSFMLFPATRTIAWKMTVAMTLPFRLPSACKRMKSLITASR